MFRRPWRGFNEQMHPFNRQREEAGDIWDGHAFIPKPYKFSTDGKRQVCDGVVGGVSFHGAFVGEGCAKVTKVIRGFYVCKVPNKRMVGWGVVLSRYGGG